MSWTQGAAWADPRLPVAVVTGIHEQVRRAAVRELLAAYPDAVVLHHDLAAADRGMALRTVRHRGSRPARPVPVPLTNGCPCCAVRADLLPRLLEIARSGRHPLAIVELWGGSDPHPVTEALAGSEAEGADAEQEVRICAVVGAVDPMAVTEELSVPDTLREHRLHTCATDERSRAEALAHQIEYARVLAVPRAPAGGGDEQERATRLTGLAMIAQLHPTAHRVALGTGAFAGVADARFDVPAARDRVNPALAALPQPADHAGVATLLWTRRRPLHPERLYEALEQLVPAAHRSRGRFWLANRPGTMLGWDAAGANLAVEDCGSWLAAVTDREWDLYPAERRAAAALDWHPVHGDRVQQLAFTAPELDVDGITELLDSCLLTDAELRSGEPGWRALPDAFADLLDPIAG